MRHLGNLAIVCVLWTCSASLLAEEPPKTVVLICNQDLPVTALDKATVGKLFLGKTTKLADKGKTPKKVTLSTLKSGGVHNAFLKYFVNKTASQFESYWKKLVFSGKATMPKSFKTDKELVAYVAKTSGAIGYIQVDTSKNTDIMTDKVKVVTVKQQ